MPHRHATIDDVNVDTGEKNDHSPFRFRQPDDVFQLRITLMDVEPPVWRRLLVPQDVNLPRLHAILQVTMGWTNSHLHQFKIGDVRFGEPDPDFDPLPQPIDYRGIRLNQIAPQQGSTCVYEYDFGDGWEHLIEIEDELPVASVRVPLPHCVDGERACPPEDCGGAAGYVRMLAILADREHEEHEDWRRWAGPDFDPAAFDGSKVNRLLGPLRRRVRRRQ